MNKNKEFKFSEYVTKYQKEHYKVFKVNLKFDEYSELEDILKKYNLTKSDFLRKSIELFKKGSF